MSIWTHINASIRYNYLNLPGALPENPIENGVFGVPHDYYGNSPDGFSTYPGSPTLPAGSEGSMEYRVISGSDTSLACRDVIFYGDLRSYEDVDEVLQYFNAVVDPDKYSVRNGVLEIEVGLTSRVFWYNNESHVWVEMVEKDSD